MSILDHFVAIAPYFSQLILEDCHFCIADTEKFIVSLPGKKLKMNLHVGDPIREGSLTKIAIEEKRRIVREGNKELYGVAHNAICMPLMENGEVVGCVSIGISKEKNDQIEQLAQKLAAMVEEISEGAQAMSAASQQLAAAHENMLQRSEGIREEMLRISEVTTFASQVARQTHLLGLNATIQAAHAGEHGKGFSVVAKEIRKLAEHSATSAKRIEQQVEQIQSLVNKMVEEIDASNGYTQEQAAAIGRLVESLEELNQMAQKLKEISFFGETSS